MTLSQVTKNQGSANCPLCGFERPAEPCAVCAGHGVALGKRAPIATGPGNPIADLARGMDDVRRAVFALTFEREFVGALRGPIAANMTVVGAIIFAGFYWLVPALESHFVSRGGQSAHLWLLALLLGAGPAILDFAAGWAMEPIRRATEQHMLGATPRQPRFRGPSAVERLQLLAMTSFTTIAMLGLVLIPWVGIPLCTLLGAAAAAVIYMQPPLAVRGLPLALRLQALKRQPWRALGAGFGLQLAAFVPFLNLVALLPVAMITATSTYLHMRKGSAEAAHNPRL